MYNEHDRPSTQRILITAAAWIAGIAAIVAIAAVVFGASTSGLASRSRTTSVATPAAQSPATMTASVPTAQPAPAPRPTATPVAPAPSTAKKSTPKSAPATVGSGLGVVVIDAGHEGSPPSGVEPIGPGSSTMKVKLESGTSGVVTHVDESLRNLQVALVLQKVLEARGVSVLMVRTSQNVKISNAQRAQIANNAHAALFIRLHCDSGPSSVTGILTLEPGKNWYKDHPIVASSAVAAKLIHKATLSATGAKDRGITPRTDLTGFNWSQVPSVLVEMGMMSNPGEDHKLGTAAYQQKLADGMANGIVAYLRAK
ncbi:MAG TPA: N-acetylmuramoyl-L-alanine amidase [Coriobacteriia bacterium]